MLASMAVERVYQPHSVTELTIMVSDRTLMCYVKLTPDSASHLNVCKMHRAHECHKVHPHPHH